MSETALTLTVTVGLAFVGYVMTYANNLRLARRADRMARVDRQLQRLYGPLHVLAHASTQAWAAFRQTHRPGGPYFSETDPPSSEELAAWRLWMQTVFMPLNRRMIDVVLENADLLVEEKMPRCILRLLAHVYAYEAVVQRWANKDYGEHLSINEFPTEIETYAIGHYQSLKRLQRSLLGGKAQQMIAVDGPLRDPPLNR